METTFEITPSELRMNEKLIKRARRWIIAALVWKIVGPFLSGVVMNSVMINSALLLFCVNAFFILFILAGLMPLRKHTSLRIERFTRILIFALCGDMVLGLIHSLYLWIIPGGYWVSIYRTIVEVLVAFACGYLTCVAFSFLVRDERIEVSCRSAIRLLCIGVFINTIVTVSTGMCSVWFRSLDLPYTQIVASNSFSSILALVQGFLFYVAGVIFIIGYKRLFATPSAFPAEDDGVDYDSIWKPSRMTTGFLVSMLLFIALLYLMVRTVFFQQ